MQVDSDSLAAKCIWTSVAITVLLTIFFWGDWLILLGLWCLFLPALALVSALLLGYILNAAGATVDGQLWVSATEVTILDRSAEIVGNIDGKLIYEWVILKRPDTGEAIKCFYERVIDLENDDWDVPNNRWFVVVDGALYAAEDDPEVEIMIPKE